MIARLVRQSDQAMQMKFKANNAQTYRNTFEMFVSLMIHMHAKSIITTHLTCTAGPFSIVKAFSNKMNFVLKYKLNYTRGE